MPDIDLIFGNVAIEAGFITRDQLRQCLLTKRKFMKDGHNVYLADVMLYMGMINEDQIKKIEKETGPVPRSDSPIKKSPKKKIHISGRTIREWESSVQTITDLDMTVKKDPGETSGLTSLLNIRPGKITVKGKSEELKSDFVLTDLLGKGGMAVVYSAQQKSIDRNIALKLIKGGKDKVDKLRTTFISEAIVTGTLDHPNIVPVYDLGRTHTGKLFYTMKKVVGKSWKDTIEKNSLMENIEILLNVCDAVAFSHDKGVIHRDLKPENIMLGDYGEVLVMDWGIAASIDSRGKAERLTKKTCLAGTPAYMPPETARAEIDLIGPRSDIYLLGGILYEIVTGLRPHTGKSPIDCVKNAMKNEIQPTDKKGELVDIALKAMADDPEDRYKNVKSFQHALKEFKEHAESIKLSDNAQQNFRRAEKLKDYDDFAQSLYGFREALKLWPGNQKAEKGVINATLAFARVAYESGDYDLANSLLQSENLPKKSAYALTRLSEVHELINLVVSAKQKRTKRKKLIKTLTYGLFIFGIAIITILTGAYFRIKGEKEKAIKAEQQAITARHETERENYFNIISLADRKIDDILLDQARGLLLKTPADFRSWEWGYLFHKCNLELITLKGHKDSIDAISFSQDGNRIVSAGADETIIIWDVKSGRILKKIKTGSVRFKSVFFSEYGKRLTAITSDNKMIIWDVGSEQILMQTKVATDLIPARKISPDRKYQLDISCGNKVKIVETATGKIVKTLTGHHDIIGAAAFSPEGRFIVTGSWDKTAKIWDARTGSVLKSLEGHKKGIRAVAFSPDGRFVATGSWDNTIKIWDLQSLKELRFKGHTHFVESAVFSPDGIHVATCSRDKSIKIWDGDTGKIIMTLEGHKGPVYDLAYSPDGGKILTGSADNTARLWYSESGRQILILKGHKHSVSSVAFSPDGRFMATGCWDKAARIWDADTGKLLKTLKHPKPVFFVAFSPDSKKIITTSKDKSARLWDVETGKVIKIFKGHEYSVYGAAFSPDGKTLVTASGDKTIKIWDINTQSLKKTLKGHSKSVNAIAVSIDGKRIISGGSDNIIKVWDMVTGREIINLEGHNGAVNSVFFSPDGSRLLSAGRDMVAIIWAGSIPKSSSKYPK